MESMTPQSKAKTLQRWWTTRVLPRAIFLKQRWSHAERCYVTCPGNRDGLGAQLQCRLSGMLFAECQGFTYVHSPFVAFDSTAAKQGSDWPDKCENFFGIGAGELAAADVARDLGEPRPVNNPTQIRKMAKTYWSVPGCHEFADLYPHQYLRVTGRFAARYHAAPKYGCVGHYTPGAVNVALHLRRGNDLAHKMHLMSRSDETAALLQTLVGALREKGGNVVLRVFSQGTEDDFRELRQFGVEFHLNEELLSTFHSLVLADVLVMAKSCLSYSAALLSKGLKIYGPTGHRPLPGWLVLGKDGRLDRRSLTRRLETSGGPRVI